MIFGYEKFKYITVYYYDEVESVKLMIKEHYDTPEFENAIIFINSHAMVFDRNFNPNDFKDYNKRIYYFLEHETSGSFSLDQDGEYLINTLVHNVGINELWVMDYKQQLPRLMESRFGLPIKYKPMRYTTLIPQVKDIQSTPKPIDFCHIGVIGNSYPGNDARLAFINEIETYPVKIPFLFITQTANMKSVTSLFNQCKYIIDINRCYDMLTQNQVRIFELLCMGYTVCVKKVPLNIFPGLVYEFESVDDLYQISQHGEYLSSCEKYKEMTYTDEAYEQYVNNLIQLQDGV